MRLGIWYVRGVWVVQWKRGKARDPVCGMYVDPKTAVTRSILGAAYYFCNQECADKFESETAVPARAEQEVPLEK